MESQDVEQRQNQLLEAQHVYDTNEVSVPMIWYVKIDGRWERKTWSDREADWTIRDVSARG